jgi:hypothetical protein
LLESAAAQAGGPESGKKTSFGGLVAGRPTSIMHNNIKHANWNLFKQKIPAPKPIFSSHPLWHNPNPLFFQQIIPDRRVGTVFD